MKNVGMASEDGKGKTLNGRQGLQGLWKTITQKWFGCEVGYGA